MSSDTARNSDTLQRYILKVNGIVQGVGFRPFVYQLAQSYGLYGTIRNTSEGVEIDIEGGRNALETFIRKLRTNPPPLARILDFTSMEKPPAGCREFKIIPSADALIVSTGVSPDICICDDCRAELFNPADRRYRYPFINCTNCGPRYTIISGVPYDRPYTSMKSFPMCSRCETEYHDPLNRRFHAQPNACPECGPRVGLLDNRGIEISGSNDAVIKSAGLLADGAVLAVKGLGGFHLMCDAGNDAAVRTLRERKRREEKPLALMALELNDIDAFAFRGEGQTFLLNSPQRPIVLLQKKPGGFPASSVAPHNQEYGVMLPYTPLHYLLLSGTVRVVVATSGNISEEPIAVLNEEALERLNGIADFFLVHNRDILIRNDDSVVRDIGNRLTMIRRARGYVPEAVLLPEKMPEALGCGGELKNSLCFIKGNRAYLSQHTGDMENIVSFDYYREIHTHLVKILDVKPTITAHDMHPDYFTTKYAGELVNTELFPVQHHHAHMVSCMAENGIKNPVIGIILDGTGYGTDGAVWGGEVLYGDWLRFERFAHLDYVSMPGGEKAIKEPWRMAVSYLYKTYNKNISDLKLPFLEKMDNTTLKLLITMMEKDINSPFTSSCGRLFDGISALLGIRNENHFEGQAAMELEQLLPGVSGEASYDFHSAWDRLPYPIPIVGLVQQIVDDISRNCDLRVISAKFHNTLAEIFVQAALRAKEKYGANTVVLSGGCFQNAYLFLRIAELCAENGLTTIGHSIVPPNDGGISLGQAVAAAAALKFRK